MVPPTIRAPKVSNNKSAQSRSRRRRKPRLDEAEDAQGLPARTHANPAQAGLEMIMQLQSQVGNQAVARLIKSSAMPLVQRQEAGEAETPGIGASLVGLKRGDGIEFGTEAARPRVRLLQQKLNEKMNANLNVDGRFGPLTEQALWEFQESEDLVDFGYVSYATADLLMMERRPETTSENAPPEEDSQLIAASEQLKIASQSLDEAGLEIFSSGGCLNNAEYPLSGLAGRYISEGGQLLRNASNALDSAASSLREGSSGKAEAGHGLHDCGVHLWFAATRFSLASQCLFETRNGFYMSAGHEIEIVGDLLQEAATDIRRAGGNLSQQDQSMRIGDPLVGLERGDGLSEGTLHKRERVKLLQQMLNHEMEGSLEEDGKFGPVTGYALMEFQTRIGLRSPQMRVDRTTALYLRNAWRGGQPALVGVGDELQQAGFQLTDISTPLNSAAIALISSTNTGDLYAGRGLQRGSTNLAATGHSLIAARAALAGGPG